MGYGEGRREVDVEDKEKRRGEREIPCFMAAVWCRNQLEHELMLSIVGRLG